MTSLLRNLLSDIGMTPEDHARAKANSGGERLIMPKNSVQRGPELDRVLALPRRIWEEDGDRLATLLTDHLRYPGGPNPYPGGPPLPPGTQKLRPVQAAALRDAHDFGLFGSIRVGGGKTLISLLACVVLGAKRPLLLVPAKLIEKTRRETFALKKHWLIPGYVRLLSYEMLGREQSATTLEEHDPDLIIADECHKLKNRSAAVTRRVGRYLEAHEETRFIAMSGTITKRSIRDYSHIAHWCLRELAPTPRDFNTLVEWSSVLDESTRTDENKLAPGALIELCNAEEREKDYPLDPVRTVRRAYRRRFTDTPGVVATQEGALGTSLRIDQIITTMPEIEEAVIALRRDWVRPDGEVCIDDVERWRHLREIACGFFYRWNPAPPQEWLQARRAWAKFVRDILRHNRSGIDSEAQVMRAVDRGDYDGRVLQGWRAVRDSFSINTEAVWLSDGVLKTAVKWMKEERGICWVEHTEFGHELERRSGVPFYWRQGQDKKGRPIEDHPPGTPMIASIAANGEGRNLQAWSTNFVVSPPTAGSIWEQFMGRTHRDGQEADEVTITLNVVLREQIKAFDKARADARYISDTTGQEQKLCYADIDVVAQADAP